jgi:hypothetical protein
MKETITGTVQGEYARRYPSYMYRKPVEEPLAPYELYADRVYWDREYPRWKEAIGSNKIRFVELADYSVPTRVNPLYPNVIRVEIWAQPNQYTKAKDAMLLREFVISRELFLNTWKDWLLDELIREAFGPPRTTVNNCNNPPVTDA